jgi:hypothetical protein
MDDLVSGDLVTLKGHNRPMVFSHEVDVARANATGEPMGVHVDWLTDYGRLQHGVFYHDQLKMYEPAVLVEEGK